MMPVIIIGERGLRLSRNVYALFVQFWEKTTSDSLAGVPYFVVKFLNTLIGVVKEVLLCDLSQL